MEGAFFLDTPVVEVGSGTMDIVYFNFDTQVFFGEFYGLYDGEVGVPFAAAGAAVFSMDSKVFPVIWLERPHAVRNKTIPMGIMQFMKAVMQDIHGSVAKRPSRIGRLLIRLRRRLV